MKNLATLLLLIFCLSISVMGQEQRLKMMPHDKNGKIQIKLLEDQIVAKPSGFNLKVSVTNKTDSIFILYGFKDINDFYDDEAEYKKPGITAGSELFSTTRKGHWVKLELDGEQQRLQRSDTTFKRDKSLRIFRRNRIILQPKSTQIFDIPIELLGTLKKGVYNVRLFYYSGVNIVNVIDEETIKNDEKDCQGVLYQGYAESNSIKLIFK